MYLKVVKLFIFYVMKLLNLISADDLAIEPEGNIGERIIKNWFFKEINEVK